MGRLRKSVRFLRAAALGLFILFLFAIACIQVEQHVLRRQAERLLADVRFLEIHSATLRDVQDLKRKWKALAHFDGNCMEAECTLEISWKDLYFRHIGFFFKTRALHAFLLAGGRPELIVARVKVERGLVSGKGFHVVLVAPAFQAPEIDYGLLADAYSVSEFSKSYRPPPVHPDYIVGKPGGCDGPCREVHFVFSPSANSATISRLMEFDLSCLTRWIHPCRTEGDIMPSAWAQYEMDYPSAVN
jgi:hypothetical protein